MPGSSQVLPLWSTPPPIGLRGEDTEVWRGFRPGLGPPGSALTLAPRHPRNRQPSPCPRASRPRRQCLHVHILGCTSWSGAVWRPVNRASEPGRGWGHGRPTPDPYSRRCWRASTLQAPLSVGILQARILEWVVIFFSRGSSDPGIEPWML